MAGKKMQASLGFRRPSGQIRPKTSAIQIWYGKLGAGL